MEKILRGKRYTSEEKSKVVEFVNSYNLSHGRGGSKAASKEFNISLITISNWLKGSSSSSLGKAAKGSKRNKLELMLSLGTDIDELEKQLEVKRAKFEALKSSL